MREIIDDYHETKECNNIKRCTRQRRSPCISPDFLSPLLWGASPRTGNKTPESGEALLRSDLADRIGFGRGILANPDFVRRVRRGAPLNAVRDTHTLFGGGGAEGYTD